MKYWETVENVSLDVVIQSEKITSSIKKALESVHVVASP